MKSFEEVVKESTCQKRVIVVELYDKDGNLLSRESNRCNPGGVCKRIGVVQNKENYDKSSECNWTHAEIMAINALNGWGAYKSILYGHDFYCDKCESALKLSGVCIFEIVPELLNSEQELERSVASKEPQ